MQKVVSFGEFLLRFSPGAEWIADHSMPVFIGGAELNMATALATWGVPVDYISALPDNRLTAQIREYLARRGVGDALHISGDRIGTYYLQQGSDLKNASVIYDRAHSSFSELKPGMINWQQVLEGADWFHFSAITPGLHAGMAAVCLEALEVARQKNIRVSVDLNYRSKLWKFGVRPEDIMAPLMEYCQVVMGNIWSANTLLGLPVDERIHDKKSDRAYLDHATATSAALMERYPRCEWMANTFRFDDGPGIRYFATLNNRSGQFVSPVYRTGVKDRSGSGDCFMAGLVRGLLHQERGETIVGFAAAAAVGKLQEYGDATSQTIEMIQKIQHQHG